MESRKQLKYVPLRLTEEERGYLRILEAGLRVSEYTAKIDIYGYYHNKQNTIKKQQKEMLAILSGLLVSANYRLGKKIVSRSLKENKELFKAIFEVGRRYKIMNPAKMRTSYGKMMHLLQDAAIYNVLGFSLIKPIETVETLCEKHQCIEILGEEELRRACETKNGQEKQECMQHLQEKYGNKMESTKIERVINSIRDANTYIEQCAKPIKKIINTIETFKQSQPPNLLTIRNGVDGARLSHSHEQQYWYVHQSLSLWHEIMKNMYKLWFVAQADVLNETNRYKLQDTGQGLHRVQYAPTVSKLMYSILSKVQNQTGNHWVGSSVVHLGDRDVPNALIFIDKYTQVPRIINPILACIQKIDDMKGEQGLLNYIQAYFGGINELKIAILRDFFRHGFDGSGADNYYDAGSCIDGRLTSAWNWCSKIAKKKYYPIFQMTGFVGFDGDWSR